jgi:hypothetical protein
MSDLTEKMLQKPTDLNLKSARNLVGTTKRVDLQGDKAELTIEAPIGQVNEGTALLYLNEEKLDPSEWRATHFRKIKYGQGFESVKVSYERVATAISNLDLDELVKQARDRSYRTRTERRQSGERAFIVALGDTQFGKIDGDGVEGALSRVVEYLELAKLQLADYQKQGLNIGQVHIAWLGDHIEGFASQGGANTWRTQLTLNEQIRLTRRSMMHSVQLFSQTVEKMTVVAVPGNHGRVVTGSGNGTRHDDSHDTESLIAVSEACELVPGRFGHVEFYVPQTDEIAVTLDVAGTRISHWHGDRYNSGKHFDWWAKQAFGGANSRDSDVGFGAHYHGYLAEEQGQQLFIQVPALEAESTWWRHKQGTPGNPGIVTAVTSNRETDFVRRVR